MADVCPTFKNNRVDTDTKVVILDVCDVIACEFGIVKVHSLDYLYTRKYRNAQLKMKTKLLFIYTDVQ